MKKSTSYWIISILALVSAVSVIYGIAMHKRVVKDERYLSASYQLAFTQFVTDVSDVDSALQKSLLVTSSPLAGAVCSEIYAKSACAEIALISLPFSSSEFENTAGFLNKVGDYALALSQKSYQGESFTEEDRSNLKALADTAATLTLNLRSIQDSMGSSILDLKQYERSIRKGDEEFEDGAPQTLADSMSLAEKQFPEVPSLIYDGPFSENLQNIAPKFLEGKEEIDVSKGREIAANFLGIREERVYSISESAGNIPCYYYECELKDSTVIICVTKTGGAVSEVLNSRVVESSELGTEEAMDVAKKFMEKKGYSNMKESYYLISNNVLTANFSYVQDGVVCYPDLIKVGIALDDGSLKSFEASAYITSHCKRDLPQMQISREQAESKVIEGLNVLGVNNSIIPSAGKNEKLCYEFECEDTNHQKYLIYINAETGGQEKIFILLEDQNGTLTV